MFYKIITPAVSNFEKRWVAYFKKLLYFYSFFKYHLIFEDIFFLNMERNISKISVLEVCFHLCLFLISFYEWCLFLLVFVTLVLCMFISYFMKWKKCSIISSAKKFHIFFLEQENWIWIFTQYSQVSLVLLYGIKFQHTDCFVKRIIWLLRRKKKEVVGNQVRCMSIYFFFNIHCKIWKLVWDIWKTFWFTKLILTNFDGLYNFMHN